MKDETTFHPANTINDILQKLKHWLHEFLLVLPNFVLAILVFIGFLILARFFYRFTIKFLQKRNHHSAIHFTIARILRVIIISIGFFCGFGVAQPRQSAHYHLSQRRNYRFSHQFCGARHFKKYRFWLYSEFYARNPNRGLGGNQKICRGSIGSQLT